MYYLQYRDKVNSKWDFSKLMSFDEAYERATAMRWYGHECHIWKDN